MYESIEAQRNTERDCESFLTAKLPSLLVKRHTSFLLRGLGPLSEGFTSLDAARPWLFYWCLNGLALLPDNDQHIRSYSLRLRSTLKLCQHPQGGFGGGHGQLAHLATTYAAILSLAIVGDEDGYKIIDRANLYKWMMALKQENGGFAIHLGGEVDARAAYLALSVASLLNLLSPELIAHTSEWLTSCQRYEGGLAGNSDAEAHAGLSYCALASLCILKSPRELAQSLDLHSLLRWLVSRQMTVEGGYSGRTNKLVDGCYSWWAGAEFSLIETCLGITTSLYDRDAIVRYILCCSQLRSSGGMRDKPGKQPDYYHTCYCLAGLAAALTRYSFDDATQNDRQLGWHSFCWKGVQKKSEISHELNDIHPIYAVPTQMAQKLRNWSISSSETSSSDAF